jgi:hypothetical protein
MKIDKQVAKEISDKIKDFANSLETQYGVEVAKTSGSFSDAEMKLSVTMRIKDTKRDVGVLTPAEAIYDRMRQTHDLPPRGTVVSDAYGEKWMPVEWIVKGRKYNILAIKLSDGKRYKFTDRSISGMNRE